MNIKWNYGYFTNKFKYVPNHLEIVCIGTTQAHFAFDFSEYQLKAFNMAVWLNYFTYSRLLLEKYRRKISPHAIILITLEYPIFLCNEESSFTMENALQYSKILFGKDPNVSIQRQCVYRLLPDSCWSSNDFSALQKLELRNWKINHYKIWERDQIIQDIIENGWGKELGCKDLHFYGKQVTQSNRNKMNKVISDVEAIIDLCRNYGWNPVLLSLPFSKEFNDKIPQEFKKYYFYKCIDKIIEQTGCYYLDYSQDKRMENIHYYMDVWWLNRRGREKFTKIVLNECQGIDMMKKNKKVYVND